mgnify:CR=1 FL=1
MINGSETEIERMKKYRAGAIAIFWNENYSSHAFVLEQVLQKLEEAGYAGREEIIDNWKTILQGE